MPFVSVSARSLPAFSLLRLSWLQCFVYKFLPPGDVGRFFLPLESFFRLTWCGGKVRKKLARGSASLHVTTNRLSISLNTIVINFKMMKKTLITLLALASVASAETPLTLLPDFTSFTWLQKPTTDYKYWNQVIGGNGSVDAVLMTNNLKHVAGWPLHETGWRWNTGKLNYPGDVNKCDFIKDETGNKVGFSFKGLSDYMGTFAVATRKLSDLLEPDVEKLTSLSISFVATGQQDIGFSAWVWDGTQATALIEEKKNLNVGNGKENVFTKNDLSLSSDMTILFLWNAYSETNTDETNTDTKNEITSLTSSYTTKIIPEPATATLSLLALACLAARRRRASL